MPKHKRKAKLSHSKSVCNRVAKFCFPMYDPLHDEDMDQVWEDVVADGSVDRRGRLASKAKTGAWKAAPLIFGTEICERMASLGLQRNLVTYFVNRINIDKPTAAVMVSNFGGTLYLTPFLGGFLADAYMGRFWAISVFASIQVVVSHSIPVSLTKLNTADMFGVQ
ncbi:hypothetical protein L7F22_040621 [Adiantum nelumboides]|nr:hypothetical protein [Adiantum nelumboides]